MFRRRLMSLAVLTLSAFLSVFATGCRQTYEINVSEAMQLPASAQLYTACNIFYEKADSIDPRNVHKGVMIPLGTAVQIVSATNKEIIFRTSADRKEFHLIYDQSWMMIPAETYLKRYFCFDSGEEQLAKIPIEWRQSVCAGKVEKGMPREAVIQAWGYPVTARTPDLKSDTWLYYDDAKAFKTKRVIFQKDKVVEFLKLD